MEQDFSDEELQQALDEMMDSETESDTLSADTDASDEDWVPVPESSASSTEYSDSGDEETVARREWMSISAIHAPKTIWVWPQDLGDSGCGHQLHGEGGRGSAGVKPGEKDCIRDDTGTQRWASIQRGSRW